RQRSDQTCQIAIKVHHPSFKDGTDAEYCSLPREKAQRAKAVTAPYPIELTQPRPPDTRKETAHKK
ncbi:hypothetical protein, partial [Streptococcus anginosus]|uniref:hypothetical protein n=1 Tax=Streptococcus anginosus TaxID=1328 RepID=UPI0021F8B188